MTAAGWPGVRRARRAAQWGKKKYAGSLAEDVWRRLDTMDFINRGMVFAATLLLCLFPFLIVVSALAGRPAAQSLTRYTGLNSQAAADIGHLFASPAATTSAVVGTASMVFFVFGGIAAAAALQEIYEQAFDLPHRRIKDLPHRLAWLAVLIGASLLTGLAGPGLRHAGGPALLAVAGLVWATGFWWLTMRILLAGRISWRALFPAACATGVLYVAMQTVFSLVFSAMVISDEHTYGSIGTIFRPAVLPDRHRRRNHPRRGRRPRLARALTRHERDRPVTPRPAVLSCHRMRVSRGRRTPYAVPQSRAGRQCRAPRRTALRPRRGSWRSLRGEPAA
jgi:membrane protein